MKKNISKLTFELACPTVNTDHTVSQFALLTRLRLMNFSQKQVLTWEFGNIDCLLKPRMLTNKHPNFICTELRNIVFCLPWA